MSDDDSGEESSPFAWVTLVMLNSIYVCGALVLGRSLRERRTMADLVCMVTEDIVSDQKAKEALEDVWDYLVVVEKIEAGRPVQQRAQMRFGHMYNPWLRFCLTKFNAFALDRYEKVAFLDADMLCVSPPDDLFACDTPAGVCDSLRLDLQAQQRLHGRQLADAEIQRSLKGHHYAIAGALLLLQPSAEIHGEIKALAESGTIGHQAAMAGPDEYFITKFFFDRGVKWTHVHKRYAHISWAVESSLRGEVEPVFLHFVSEKPWAGPSEVTGNWPDFAMWDEVAAQVEHLAPHLFRAWRTRREMPVSHR